MRKLLIFFIIFPWACSKTTSENCAETSLYTKAKYPIGTAFNFIDYQTNPALAKTVKTHFNSITPENALKFGTIRQLQRAPYNFIEMDSILNIAQKQNARVHGHTLIWHQQLPAWFNTFNGNYKDLLNSHITTVMARFKKDIKSWDVVNEALTEQGELRASPWRDKVGDDYVYLAFEAAKSVVSSDAAITLFYNDYNLVLNPRKLDAAIKLCTELRERGIPNVGIGMQMHITSSFPAKADLARAVEKVWRAGFKIHFSEADVSLNILGNKNSLTAADYEAQANKYREIAEVYNQIPEQYQFGITFWGVGDADSWIPTFFNRTDAPLLFDENYAPKPAFCGFTNGL